MKNYPVCKVLIIYYVSKRCNLSMTFTMKIGLVAKMLYVQLIIIQSRQDVSGQGLGSTLLKIFKGTLHVLSLILIQMHS